MSINQDQFEKLSEMGISLWQRRDLKTKTEPSHVEKHLTINLEKLFKEQLFNDILLATGLSIGEVHQQGDHLDLGFFNWFFTEAKNNIEQETLSNEKEAIRWSEHQLFTPSISKISQSPALKKQLWHLLSCNI